MKIAVIQLRGRRKPGSIATNFIVAILSFVFSAAAVATCQLSGLQLQILGSGGPGASGGRASSAYILWLDGRSRILIDAGGGSKNMFHQSDANLESIELIALSHFHPDHSAELPAILWPAGGSFALSGPDGNEVFPSVQRFAQSLFGPGGSFAILGGRLEYNTIEIPTTTNAATAVWSNGEINVLGIGVPHGDVPTVGYRVDYGSVSIAFTSDQNGSSAQFAEFIRGVDYLVIHMAGNEDSTGISAALHAKPSVWGQMATGAGARQVIVSHISTSDPAQLEQNLSILADNFNGQITVSDDLMCIDVK